VQKLEHTLLVSFVRHESVGFVFWFWVCLYPCVQATLCKWLCHVFSF